MGLSDSAIDGDARLADGLKAVVRIFGQATAEEFPDRWRRRRGQHARVGFTFDDACQDFRRRVARVERPAGQHFVQHDAERPDVCPFVRRLATRLFGRHVRRSAQNEPGVRCEPRHRWRVPDIPGA